jgi:ABC-type sugar transport system ATPase subunit
MFRPDDLVMRQDLSGSGRNVFLGTVNRVVFLGNRLKCEIQVGSSVILAEFSPSLELKEGEKISMEIPSSQICVFDH